MRDQNVFFVISGKKNSGNAFEIWYITYWINLLQNPVDNFHLAWITSLHYFVKPKMLIAGMLPLNCCTKKLHSLSHLICDNDDSSRSVMPNLYTFSCNISPHTSMSSLDWLKMQNTFNLLDQYCGHTTKYKHCKHNTCHRETNKCREYSIRHTRHSSIRVVMMSRLHNINTISFCLNLHSIITISFNLYLQWSACISTK